METTEKLQKRPFINQPPDLEMVIGSQRNYVLLKSYYRILFDRKLSESEKRDKVERTYAGNEKHRIMSTVEMFSEYGLMVRGFDEDGELIIIAPTKSDAQMHIEKKYPLREEGYNKEQTEYFKKLARTELPISMWPKKIFDEN